MRANLRYLEKGGRVTKDGKGLGVRWGLAQDHSPSEGECRGTGEDRHPARVARFGSFGIVQGASRGLAVRHLLDLKREGGTVQNGTALTPHITHDFAIIAVLRFVQDHLGKHPHRLGTGLCSVLALMPVTILGHIRSINEVEEKPHRALPS